MFALTSLFRSADSLVFPGYHLSGVCTLQCNACSSDLETEEKKYKNLCQTNSHTFYSSGKVHWRSYDNLTAAKWLRNWDSRSHAAAVHLFAIIIRIISIISSCPAVPGFTD